MDSRPKFKIIIAGSRDFNDYKLLKSTMDDLLSEKNKTHKIEIVSGMAKGADTLGVLYAKERKYNIIEYRAQWRKYGKAAGMIRNGEMLDVADAIVTFWNGMSPGTLDVIKKAEARGIPCRVVKVSHNTNP